MSETFYPFSKAKGIKYARSHAPLIATLERSLGSLTATLRQFTRGITWRIKPMSERPSEPLPAERTSGLRMTKFADMSDAGSNTAGLRSSLLDALRNCIQSLRSAMKPFTNGSTLMPESLFRPLSGRIATASDEVIHGVTRKPIFRREYPSKNALKRSCYAKSLDTGRQTPLSRAKVWRRCKSALSVRPGLPSSLNCSGKELAR